MTTARFASSLVAVAVMTAVSACSGGSQLPVPSRMNLAAPLSAANAMHGKQLLYVADQPNQRVVIFKQSDGTTVGQITDAISGPDGLAMDKAGTLYVCNFGSGTVTEYLKGQTTHSKTLTGVGSPKYVTVGRDGTVYVSDFHGSSNGNVYEFAGGSTTPTTTIHFQTFPAGLALDRHNKLYVAYDDSTNTDIEVLKFTPGKTNGKNLGIHVKFGSAGGLAFDKSGNMLLVNQASANVDVFPPHATSPSQQYNGFSLAYQIALNSANTDLFVSNPGGSVEEIAYPSGTSVQNIVGNLGGAYGVATW